MASVNIAFVRFLMKEDKLSFEEALLKYQRYLKFRGSKRQEQFELPLNKGGKK